MQISLKPELQRFIEQQVKTGRFSSEVEVLEAGVARLMLDSDPPRVNAEEAAEINESLGQMRRGEVINWREHSTQLRKKYLGH